MRCGICGSEEGTAGCPTAWKHASGLTAFPVTFVTGNGRDECEHGSLRRSCLACETASELRRLTAALSESEQQRDMLAGKADDYWQAKIRAEAAVENAEREGREAYRRGTKYGCELGDGEVEAARLEGVLSVVAWLRDDSSFPNREEVARAIGMWAGLSPPWPFAAAQPDAVSPAPAPSEIVHQVPGGEVHVRFVVNPGTQSPAPAERAEP